MIYYHPQLMPDARSYRLYAVDNPVPFANGDDHEAALLFRLLDLVQEAIADGQFPQALIKDSLGLVLDEELSAEDIAYALLASDALQQALQRLHEGWALLEESHPGGMGQATVEVARTGVAQPGLSSEARLLLWQETTLDTWLQALVG